VFRLSFSLCIGKDANMSTEDNIAWFASNKERNARRDEMELKQREVKDEHFRRLREELNRLFNEEVSKFAHDERAGNILAIVVEETETRVTYKDAVLTIKFDKHTHTAKMKHAGRVKLDYAVEVCLTGLTPLLRSGDGKNREDAPQIDNMGWVKDKGIRALLS
jgi:hypothetical protein